MNKHDTSMAIEHETGKTFTWLMHFRVSKHGQTGAEQQTVDEPDRYHFGHHHKGTIWVELDQQIVADLDAFRYNIYKGITDAVDYIAGI
jgi:hypothetical protein